VRCISCKGRGLCGRLVCPILRRLETIAALPRIGAKVEGISPPEVFVGRHGYPVVRAGPVVPLAPAAEKPQQPSLGMDLGEIISLRASAVRSEARVGVRAAECPGKLLESFQEIAMSSIPVGIEVSFLKPPKPKLSFDGVVAPSGPSGEIKSLELTTNPAVSRKVDEAVEERAGASVAVGELYSAGVGVDHISRLLSLGLLGKVRKLVPTRWSITASDDMLGKAMIESIVDAPMIGDYLLYSREALGNHFEILLTPRPYSFELVEIWMPGSAWAPDGWIGSDKEDNTGKKGYSPLAGGYYAARLVVLEYLAQAGRQAGILAVREISRRYWAPLGVWVVRDAARQAMTSRPCKFDSLKAALDELGGRISTPTGEWLPRASLLTRPVQKSLAEFF
jgi:DNA repair protein NreA